MKFVKWMIVFVAVLLGLFVLITFFLPTDYKIERSVEIEAPQELVFSQVENLEIWQEWNPWNEMDPDMVIEYGENTTGAGAHYKWSSEVAGDGSMTIIASDPPEHVRFEMSFEGYEETPAYSSIYVSGGPVSGTATVVWTFEGSTGDKLFSRWMSVMVDKFVGPSYEKGLQTLKEQCEKIVSDPESVFRDVPIP